MTTSEALQFISRMRKQRWSAGRSARGAADDDPFLGRPQEELLEELIDALNYLDVLQGAEHGMELWRVSSLNHHITQATLLVLGHEKG